MYKIIPLFLLILVTVFSCSTSTNISNLNAQDSTEVFENVEVAAIEPLLTVVDTPTDETDVTISESVLPVEDVNETASAEAQETDLDSVLVSRNISLLGEDIKISAYDGYAIVEYPLMITNEDIANAIGVLLSTYPGVFNDVYYELSAPGYLKVVYPKGLTTAFLNDTIAGLERDLEFYVASLFVEKDTSKETESLPVVTDNSVDSTEPVEKPVEQAESNVVTTVPEQELAKVKTDVVPTESPATVDVTESESAFPTPVLDDTVSPTLLKVLSVVIVSTVIFTVSVAIRGANRLKLQKGISIALSLLFPALSIVISTLVSGWSNVWLIYLVLLLTYFIFRAEWRGQSHFG